MGNCAVIRPRARRIHVSQAAPGNRKVDVAESRDRDSGFEEEDHPSATAKPKKAWLPDDQVLNGTPAAYDSSTQEQAELTICF